MRPIYAPRVCSMVFCEAGVLSLTLSALPSTVQGRAEILPSGAALLKKWPPSRPKNGRMADATSLDRTYSSVRTRPGAFSFL